MHRGSDSGVVLAVPEGLELLDRGRDRVEIDGFELSDIDLGVAGAIHLFGIEAELLKELFAGSCSGEDDGDILFGLAAELDEIPCEIDDLDGLAHIEDEDFAVLPHSPGLHDELAGFGDGHEIAHHVGVRDRDGAA